MRSLHHDHICYAAPTHISYTFHTEDHCPCDIFFAKNTLPSLYNLTATFLHKHLAIKIPTTQQHQLIDTLHHCCVLQHINIPSTICKHLTNMMNQCTRHRNICAFQNLPSLGTTVYMIAPNSPLAELLSPFYTGLTQWQYYSLQSLSYRVRNALFVHRIPQIDDLPHLISQSVILRRLPDYCE